jgi:predicted transcriptional regulator
MAFSARETLATQVNSELLARVRDLAQSEGRQLQALVDEALADLIEKRDQGKPRAAVMAAYQASHERFSTLYKKLAE